MAGSLRDQLETAVEEQEVAQQTPASVTTGAVGETTAAPSAASVSTPAVAAVETPEQKAGRTANRLRDEAGRLLPGKKESAPPQSPEGAPKGSAVAGQAPAVVADPVKPKINRPSSWKKDHWESFDKLATENPGLAEYINQRESEFAKGVSAYKAEYDRAKPILEAITPFQGAMQQYGLEPAKHISSLLNAHQTLALGAPRDRLVMFAKLAKDYQIPLEQLFVKGQDGQIYFNTQLQASAQQPQQQQPAQDVRKTVQDLLAEERMQLELKSFADNTEKYPHFQTVRETMAGLLQSGLASDLADAYEAALRHPRHADIFDAMQEQQRQADSQRAAEEKRRAADTARRNQISPKSAPGTGPTAGGSGKGLRGALSEAFEAHTPGRV